MKDTRLLQVREMARDCQRILDELLDEDISSFVELTYIRRGRRAAEKLLSSMDIYEPEVMA